MKARASRCGCNQRGSLASPEPVCTVRGLASLCLGRWPPRARCSALLLCKSPCLARRYRQNLCCVDHIQICSFEVPIYLYRTGRASLQSGSLFTDVITTTQRTTIVRFCIQVLVIKVPHFGYSKPLSAIAAKHSSALLCLPLRATNIKYAVPPRVMGDSLFLALTSRTD